VALRTVLCAQGSRKIAFQARWASSPAPTRNRRSHGLLVVFPALSRQVLQRLEVVDDVRHGGPHALTASDGRQVREFFAPADGKRQRAVAYPGLLDLQIMRHVLDKLMDRGLVLLVGCQLGIVQKIHDWALLQERRIGDRLPQRDQCLGESLAPGGRGAGKLRTRRKSRTPLAGRGGVPGRENL